MIKLHGIQFENGGKRIVYDYAVDRSVEKYFKKKPKLFAEYDVDVSLVPPGILAIPFLANVMPIAWFAGFDVFVDEADETFDRQLGELKREFAIHFPKIDPESKLHAGKLMPHEIKGGHMALLFSGGLDAFESLTRNIDKDPYLISIQGADIALDDDVRWNDFKRFNSEEPIIRKERQCYVRTNLRDFYTFKVDLLVDIGWWGKVQHGMALVGMTAPLTWVYGIETVLIASSNTGEVSFGWGSTSETDEKVKWANMKTVHDGFHLRRTEKIENIVGFAKKTGQQVKLRVCYSEIRTGYNCSRCAKCQRTMFGFILDGANPNLYGFNVPDDFYALLLSNFGEDAVMTTGVAYEWRCLQDKARTSEKPFILKNEAAERKNIGTFAALRLDEIINKNAARKFTVKKMKYVLIQKYPGLFNAYMKIRRKF
jgi:hypothetical protein